jgi:uncharacterized protein (DUF1684 family)
MVQQWYKAALFLLPSLLFITCKQGYSPEQQNIINQIETSRLEKDSLFKHADWSPLTDEEKEHFSGLNYFPIDLSLRFEGPLELYASPIPDTIMGTKGDLRPAIRFAYFAFAYQNRKYRLELHKILRDDPEYDKYLFLGFTDETTGDESYATGRYIDVSENPENYYVIDFNLAYNPYCAYNSRYTCAIPGEENRLPFAIRAGERIYKEHE